MYTSFFGLKSKPFQLTPDPEFLFLSRVHRKALTYLNYGITSDSGGFILITGEVGTGKTTAIRSMMKGLKEEIIFSRINNTRLTSEQLITMINDDFGLDTKGKDKPQMLRELTDFLIEQYGRRRKSVLIIDEAQNLSPDLLEEIRLLSNLETDKAKLLQIIMVGQPELRRVLSQPELRALRQRITVSCHVYPLTREETEKYIFHRLTIAGNKKAVIFQDGSIDLIHNFSRGVPRLINILCDFLLLTAFIEKTKEISLDMVKDVISDLEKENKYWQDAIPERYFNGMKALKEMSKRAENPEEVSFKRDFNNGEKGEVFENIYETEKLLNAAIDRFNTEFINRDTINMDARLKDIVKEIKEIKSHFPKELKQITSKIQEKKWEEITEKEIKKRNIWAKIFYKK
jgi:putative secretion ATPase (PEP-CTERM system associated)